MTERVLDPTDIQIRLAGMDDLDDLLQLCAEHACHEGSAYVVQGKREGLGRALFSPSPRLWAWVAQAESGLVGYVTATREFSTWQACDFLHMDCLYVCASRRNVGLGAALLKTVAVHARKLGLQEIQWQTPDWNLAAARFYRRAGATDQRKLRFSLRL